MPENICNDIKIKSLCSFIFNGGHFEIQDGRHNFGPITCVPQYYEIK